MDDYKRYGSRSLVGNDTTVKSNILYRLGTLKFNRIHILVAMDYVRGMNGFTDYDTLILDHMNNARKMLDEDIMYLQERIMNM